MPRPAIDRPTSPARDATIAPALSFFAALIVACVTGLGAASVSAGEMTPLSHEMTPLAHEMTPLAHEMTPLAQASPGPSAAGVDVWPIAMVVVGIVSVLGLIIGLKLNAFLALVMSALLVSLLVGWTEGQNFGSRMNAVVDAFGDSAGKIGIVIAMAAIIGKCMLDSGAADRIVRTAVGFTGEKRAPIGLMVSGFVLAIPVFFDTVFYLLVPLARSLHMRTGKNYLRYLLAIATGGAITHTLVPPTPGPLLVAAILGVDVGVMIIVGVMVALPSALIGLVFAIGVDRIAPIPMRPLGIAEGKHEPLEEARLPSFAVALIPVVLPVLLIGAGTLATTLADREDRARLRPEDIRDYDAFAAELAAAPDDSPAARILASDRLTAGQSAALKVAPEDGDARADYVALLNRVLSARDLFDADAFAGVAVSQQTLQRVLADNIQTKPVERRRTNRLLLEEAYPDLIEPHRWDSPARRVADSLGLWSNPNLALMLAALAAMATVKRVRRLSWRGLGGEVETALMSGGLIILITAGGGAFGKMLSDTGVSGVIQDAFADRGGSGIGLLLLGWTIACFLKIAQGSSTVAMIVGAGMMGAILAGAEPAFHPAYIATAVGSGSLMGSWMNDSGFWVFTKMGGLTEGESLRSWTPLLMVLSLGGLAFTIALSQLLPMQG